MAEEQGQVAVQSPPASAQPVQVAEDPRAQLHRLAEQLRQGHGRRQLVEYLRLRRSAR